VELIIVDRASDNTIGRTLEKHSQASLQKQWVIPPDANAAFIASMEDMPEVYQRPHDPDVPLVCLDESPKQLITETRVPITATPGCPARHDYEYARTGTANLFMMLAPLEGWRHVKGTNRHTAVDCAQVLREISDTRCPAARKIVLVQDNFSAQKPASLYERFPPPRLAGWANGSSGTTRPGTAAGWIWLSPNSASCQASASIGVSRTSRPDRASRRPGGQRQ
jgi:hypothetical protein